MSVEILLNSCGVEFEVLHHDPQFTATTTAGSLNIPPDRFAKTVVLRVDDQPVLAVVPANKHVDILAVCSTLQAKDVKLVDEVQLKEIFPDCELRAIPPFGSEYDFQTVIDESLTLDEMIAFESDSHRRAICMRFQDFEEIERPQIAWISKT